VSEDRRQSTPPDPAAVTRLANKTATLTLASCFAFIVAVVALPTALRDGKDVGTRVAAGAPLSAAIGTAAWAYRTRTQLRVARERDEAAADRSGASSAPRE
jgi:hypothetical protein